MGFHGIVILQGTVRHRPARRRSLQTDTDAETIGPLTACPLLAATESRLLQSEVTGPIITARPHGVSVIAEVPQGRTFLSLLLRRVVPAVSEHHIGAWRP